MKTVPREFLKESWCTK